MIEHVERMSDCHQDTLHRFLTGLLVVDLAAEPSGISAHCLHLLANAAQMFEHNVVRLRHQFTTVSTSTQRDQNPPSTS